jgi:hypothetical protein
MDIEDGKKILADASKNTDLAYKRIEESKKMVAKAINILEAAVERVKWACDDGDWDSGVAYQIEEAAEKLGYALATLTTWDDEDKEYPF